MFVFQEGNFGQNHGGNLLFYISFPTAGSYFQPKSSQNNSNFDVANFINDILTDIEFMELIIKDIPCHSSM